MRLVSRTLGYVEHALPAVASADAPWARSWTSKASACNDLLERVVDQTRRRVFGGETVPAQEKLVSLFEPHTDIIVKGGRGTHYGHKVNFATGRSGLALDVVVEDGNPADSARCLPMLARHVEHYGAAPTHAAFDGGYASRENLKAAKALGVSHAVFHKKRGMKVADMTPSAWLYRQLKRFRAGVEAGISYLKRCFGLGLCRWRGLPRFKAYVQSAVFAHKPDAARSATAATGLTPSSRTSSRRGSGTDARPCLVFVNGASRSETHCRNRVDRPRTRVKVDGARLFCQPQGRVR